MAIWLHKLCTKKDNQNSTYSYFSSWWLNHPFRKICSSNWIVSPSRGENKTYLSCHHPDLVLDSIATPPTNKHFEPKVLEVWFTSLKQRTCQVAMPPKKEFPIPVLLGSLLVLQKHGTPSIWQSDTNMLNSSWGTPLDFNIKPILNETLMINIPNKMQETISSGNPMFHPGTQHLTVIFYLMLWPYGTHHRFLKDQQDIEQRLLMALNRSTFYGERWRDTTWIPIFGIKGFGHTIYVDSLINING